MLPITTDFHSHILPGADHGSDGIVTSRKQLDIIRASGIERVVATPHFYPASDNLQTFLARREKCAAALKGAIREGDPDVLLGAEVLICDGIDRMEGLESLTVLGTECILLEMPMTKWGEKTYETVDSIASAGFRVVMAHIDRYDPKYIEDLMTLDVKAQLNPGVFATRKGRRFAEKWLSRGKVVAVGSDLHGANEKEYREFTDAAAALGSYAKEVDGAMRELLSGAKTL